MEVPKWLKGTLDASGAQRIEEAVLNAERTTSAELVPMIVHSSAPTGHVGRTLLLLLALTLFIASPLVVMFFPDFPLFWIELAALVLAGILAFAMRDWDFWKRRLTPVEDQTASAERRAELEFYRSGIKATENNTGVLIFVSLLEHRAVVLADKAVAQKFPAETWSEIVGELLEKTKAGDFAGGMIQAIEHTGRILSESFPKPEGNRDELPNHLIIKE